MKTARVNAFATIGRGCGGTALARGPGWLSLQPKQTHHESLTTADGTAA